MTQTTLSVRDEASVALEAFKRAVKKALAENAEFEKSKRESIPTAEVGKQP